MAVWEALQIAVKRGEVKSKGEKERYKHLNAGQEETFLVAQMVKHLPTMWETWV